MDVAKVCMVLAGSEHRVCWYEKVLFAWLRLLSNPEIYCVPAGGTRLDRIVTGANEEVGSRPPVVCKVVYVHLKAL